MSEHRSNGDSPPRYESLEPRPPPYENTNPSLTSGRRNSLDGWDNHGFESSSSGSPPPSPPPPTPRTSQDQDGLSADIFDYRSVTQHLYNPYAPPSRPGNMILVESYIDGKRVLVCQELFRARWRCASCPPGEDGTEGNWWHNETCLSRDRHAALPVCARPGCRAAASAMSVLTNAQREDVARVDCENLMLDRVGAEPYTWCCRCKQCRGPLTEGARDGIGCAHCADYRDSVCRDCVRCNRFLEPTRFCNGDYVMNGLLDLHYRALGYRLGRGRVMKPDTRWASGIIGRPNQGPLYVSGSSARVRVLRELSWSSLYTGQLMAVMLAGMFTDFGRGVSAAAAAQGQSPAHALRNPYTGAPMGFSPQPPSYAPARPNVSFSTYRPLQPSRPITLEALRGATMVSPTTTSSTPASTSSRYPWVAPPPSVSSRSPWSNTSYRPGFTGSSAYNSNSSPREGGAVWSVFGIVEEPGARATPRHRDASGRQQRRERYSDSEEEEGSDD